MHHFWSNASFLEQCIRYMSSSQFNTNKPKKMDFALRLTEEEGTAITNWPVYISMRSVILTDGSWKFHVKTTKNAFIP
jgi:predicted transcriptional regulator